MPSITGDSGRDRKLLVLLIVGSVTCGCCLFSPLIALGNMFSHGANDFRNQCDSALGPDPSVTVTATTSPVRASEPAVTQSALPSTNPYSSMTLDPRDRDIPDRYRTCVTAMRSAPYQRPDAIQTPNSGAAVACAQHLALRYANEGSGDPAALVRDVVYAASAAARTGQCAPGAAPPGGGCGARGGGGPRRGPGGGVGAGKMGGGGGLGPQGGG
ncbi:hypothetical protein, partial [Nocardia carnea]|uniref:hypothetical protein n=1 Tax=Nocardia carnea TaxID=37328 RepID=UPI002457C103